MIILKDPDSNIFDSECIYLVNPVNCVGVMGAGLALEFRKRYPQMYEEYKDLCGRGRFGIGEIQIVKVNPSGHKYIINFPTKRHWNEPSQLNYIEIGLKRLLPDLMTGSINSIAFPALGCGLGGLDWENEVKPLMLRYLEKVPDYVRIEIYPPKKMNRLCVR